MNTRMWSAQIDTQNRLGGLTPCRDTRYRPGMTTSLFEVWDNRECVSRHSTALDAHKTVLQSRHSSLDSGRRLTLFDAGGRLVSVYIDGREQVSELDGSALRLVA